MAKTYIVGDNDTVRRIDNHTYPAIPLSSLPSINGDPIKWRDVMTHPTNENIVIIVGEDPEIVEGGNYSIQVSTDSGASWVKPGGDWEFAENRFFEVWWTDDPEVVWVVGAFGHVVRSIDGGLTFNEVTQITLNGGHSIIFTPAIHAINKQTAIVAGSNSNSNCYVWKTTDGGTTWNMLNGGLSLVHPNALSPIGIPSGIWMSNDETRIVLGTYYTNQLSINNGVSFTGSTDGEVEKTYMNRSGVHLTWYPSYIQNPSVFRHVGGSIYQITESINEGNTYFRTRHSNSALIGGVIPSGNGNALIAGAHFYDLNLGYYLIGSQVFNTSDGGITGVAIDNNDDILNAVWTGISQISENPIYFNLVDCCNDNIFLNSQGEPFYLEFTGNCISGLCFQDILDSIITYFIGPDEEGSGCFSLNAVVATDLVIGNSVPYEDYINDQTSLVDTCEECCIVFPCFRLIDCTGIQDDIYTSTDLTDYLNNTIVLQDDEGNFICTCWNVEISNINCINAPEVNVYRCYDDCEDCNIPTPSIPVPTNRRVEPGYRTGNCDPHLVEKAFCNYASLRHKNMMSSIYMIENCCPKDEDKLWCDYIKMTLSLLKDVNPNVDSCNPKCYSHEATIQPNHTSITNYVDCYGINQTIETTLSEDLQIISFCALDTTPSIIDIYNDEGTLLNSYFVPIIGDCEVLEEIYYEYQLTIDSRDFEENGLIINYVDLEGVKQVLLISICNQIGGCPAEVITFCARYGSIQLSDVNNNNIVFANNESCPIIGQCVKDVRLIKLGNCP